MGKIKPMLRLGDKKSAFENGGFTLCVKRDPIGDVNVIKNVSDKRVKDFIKNGIVPTIWH